VLLLLVCLQLLAQTLLLLLLMWMFLRAAAHTHLAVHSTQSCSSVQAEGSC
jgi:hypothetical protein